MHQVAHQARAHPAFSSMKQPGVFLLHPPPPLHTGWDASSVAPSITFASTHLSTRVERGTVRVKWLARQHSTMSPARA